MTLSTIRLGELMLRRGGSVDPAKHKDEEFDLYSIPAFDRGASELVMGCDIGSSKQQLEKNDILLSKIVPHIRRAWVVGASRGRRQIGSGEWIVFRSKAVNPRYLSHVLVGDPFHKAFMQTVSGVGGSLLRARPAQVAEIQIPLPPLAEQKRIAAILDAADALRTKRREAIAQLDALLQSTFLTLFGDPAENPKKWPLQTVGSLACKFSDGPFGSNLKSAHYTETGVRVIRLQNIGVGEFVNKDTAFISTTHFSGLKKHECLPGDVLIGTLGDPNLRACIQPEWLDVALNKADCVQLRPNPKVASAAFVSALLNQASTERLAQSLMQGQTRVRISMGRLRNLLVPLPPLPLQQKFAAIVESIERQKTTQRTHLAELDALFAALQHRAFRGEL